MSDQIQQRSPEWHKQRAKKFTASKIISLCADGSRKMTEEELAQHKIDFPKSKKTTTWDITEGLKTYALEKAIDFFVDPEEDLYLSSAVEEGKEREPLAFEKFKSLKALEFLEVEEAEFISNDGNSGSSPDGKVSNNSVYEAKCPNKTTFFKVVLTNEIDKKHFFQMQKQMKDTGTNQCYYFVYYIQDGEEYWHEIIVPRCNTTIELIEERILIAVKLRDEYVETIRKNAQWLGGTGSVNNIDVIGEKVFDATTLSNEDF